MTLLALVASLVLAVSGCTRVVTAPKADPEVATAAAYTVMNGDDSGTGSLRDVVAAAPADAIITFDPSVTTVTLTSGPLVLDKSVTITGPDDGMVTVYGNDSFPIVTSDVSAAQFVLRRLSIAHGRNTPDVWAAGGGIQVLWPDWAASPPSLTLDHCTVTDNFATYEGGGVYVEGTLVMLSTTVHGDSVDSGGYGGGVTFLGTSVDGSDPYPSAATIVNSTISGNTASYGGAVENCNGAMSIVFSTITGNTATTRGGGVFSYNDSATRTTFKGTIVAGNASSYGADDVYDSNGVNRFDSLGYNVVGAGSGQVDFTLDFTANGDLTGVTDAGLLALTDNGGPTPTHALEASSVALNHVPTSDCTDVVGTALTTDQRGVQRPQGSQCDSGAFEYDAVFTEYVLAVSVVPDGAGTVAGAGSYAPDAVAERTATPAEHWEISHWSADLDGSDNPATITMDGNKTVVANFTQVSYAVTETLDGGGSVVREPAGSSYPYGTTVTVTAVPTDEWHFDHWSGAATGDSISTSFIVTGPMAYTAHFIRWYPLIVDVVGGGHVARNLGGDDYQAGTVVTLTATPETGWRFDHWSGDLEGSDAAAQVWMTAARSVTATFVEDTYTVAAHADGYGSVTGGGTYAYGATATLIATPGSGSYFVTWSADASGTTNPLALTVTNDMDITAHFGLLHTLDVAIQGEGAVDVDPPEGPYADGTSVTLTAIPASGWLFATWSGSVTGSENPVTLEMHDSEAVTAIFVPILGPTLTVAIDGDGRVTSEPEGIDCVPTGGACVAAFPDKTRVTLHAVPAECAMFVGWTGAVYDAEPDVTIRLRSDGEVTAHFVTLNGPVVTIDPIGSFRGNTAVVTGSLVCAAGSYDLDVSIVQEVKVGKEDPQIVSAATTLIDVACGQPWSATLVSADDEHFARSNAEVTVVVDDLPPQTATVRLR